MRKTDDTQITEMEKLAATITEGTKSTLRDLLSEAVSNYLKEEVLEDEDEKDEDEDVEDAETSDVDEDAETSEESDDAEEAPADAEEADEAETDGDEWADFNEYKIGNDEGIEEYDFTNLKDTDSLVKVFKLMNNDDQVSVVKDGDKVSVKDNEAGTEYVIELNCDSSENNEDFNAEMTMAESLGYTDNYQDKDPIAGLSMDGAPKNTKDWHKGVPTGTSKPWAGKGKSEPFGKKTEKVFEITLNDDVDTEEEVIDENATTSKYQQRRMVKTMVPDNAYVQDGAHEVSQGGKLKTESLQKKIDAALLENKQLKETVAKVSKLMKEAVQVNVNLGHIVRLMVENTTTKNEKEDIIKRYSNVKTNKEAKSLYESISSELKKTHSTIVNEQVTTVEGSKKINESKIYDEPNGVLDMMKRMKML